MLTNRHSETRQRFFFSFFFLLLFLLLFAQSVTSPLPFPTLHTTTTHHATTHYNTAPSTPHLPHHHQPISVNQNQAQAKSTTDHAEDVGDFEAVLDQQAMQTNGVADRDGREIPAVRKTWTAAGERREREGGRGIEGIGEGGGAEREREQRGRGIEGEG